MTGFGSTYRSARLIVLVALAALAAGLAVAQPRKMQVQVAMHLHCFSGVPEADRRSLDYWSGSLARGNRDPDCVAREPILGPLPLQRVTIHTDEESEMEVVRLEVDAKHRAGLEQATVANLRQVVAITVQERIVGTAFLTGAISEPRITLYLLDKAAAAALVSDLKILLGPSR